MTGLNEKEKMADGVTESGILKRKIEENNTPDTKDKDVSSPLAKVRAIGESTSDPATSKANVLDVTPSTSAASQNTVTESNSETSEEREKMQ